MSDRRVNGTCPKWTEAESKIAAESFARLEGTMAVRQIAQVMAKALPGRSDQAILRKLSECGPQFTGPRADSLRRRYRGVPVKPQPPAAEALREREHRLALEYESVTAALMGDPPKGYSALDRHRQVTSLPSRPKISATLSRSS